MLMLFVCESVNEHEIDPVLNFNKENHARYFMVCHDLFGIYYQRQPPISCIHFLAKVFRRIINDGDVILAQHLDKGMFGKTGDFCRLT